MADDSRNPGLGFGGLFTGNCAILFFILVFLCLFTGFGGFFGCGTCRED